MSMSRRSFLKLAGLTTVAAAGVLAFSGCSVACVLQITNKDHSIFDEDEQEALNAVNTILKFAPIPFTDRVKASDVESAITKALNKEGVKIPEGFSVYVTNQDKDGYVVATGDFISTLTVDISLRKVF